LTTNSPQIEWPRLDQAYVDQVGPIDADIYAAACEIWPRAERLATKVLSDEAAGQFALLTVCARITAARAGKRIHVENLGGYIYQSFRYEILRLLQQRRLHDEITANKYAAEAERAGNDVLKKILIEEILARMDAKNRLIFERLLLGYSFEEIAKITGERSNVLRNRFSRQLAKIRRELEP
jgi:DNA-directed RNA polymerase specialized sigma24 family protein